jgi:hypothetical protein
MQQAFGAETQSSNVELPKRHRLEKYPAMRIRSLFDGPESEKLEFVAS